jgi:hypothetical protein
VHAGGYWSLDKRLADVPKLQREWQRWRNATAPLWPDLVNVQDVAQLAARLQTAAESLAAQLADAAAPGQPLATTVHGDFKTANLFFRQPAASSAPDAAEHAAGRNAAEATASGPAGSRDALPAPGLEVAACDLQWVGRGAAVLDVVYLLWTSVEPTLVRQHEGALLREYWRMLRAALAERGVAEAALPSEVYTRRLYDVRPCKALTQVVVVQCRVLGVRCGGAEQSMHVCVHKACSLTLQCSANRCRLLTRCLLMSALAMPVAMPVALPLACTWTCSHNIHILCKTKAAADVLAGGISGLRALSDR